MNESKPHRVLVVEDEPTISDAVLYALRREGYECQAVADGRQAESVIASFHPRVVVLDVMLPGVDGFTILRGFPQDRPFGVILVTARDDITDKVSGLELGADDYLTKPFDMRELLARVRSLLRRLPAPSAGVEGTIIWRNIVIDQATREVAVGGRNLSLTPKEFDLAAMLLGNPGRVYTRVQLLESVWGYDYAGATRTVDIHIQRLRKKFAGVDPSEVNGAVPDSTRQPVDASLDGSVSEVFQTVHGIGYRALRALT